MCFTMCIGLRKKEYGYRQSYKERNTLKHSNTKSLKSHVDGKYTGSLDLTYCYISFEFLIVDKQTTAAKRYGNGRGTDEINQPRYFKNVLTLKWK